MIKRLENKTRILLLSIVASIGISPIGLGAEFPIHFGGSIRSESGIPLTDPVDLEAQFFRTESGGSSISDPISFKGVPLTNGHFSLEFNFTPAQRMQIFDGGSRVFIEITDLTHERVLPRLEFKSVPIALWTPVDGSTLVYDANGKLSISGAGLSSLQDKLTNSSVLSLGDLQTTGEAAVNITAAGPNSEDTGLFKLKELAGNGTATVGFRAPSSIDSSVVWVLPDSDGTTGQYLTTNGSATLTWSDPAADTHAGSLCAPNMVLDGDGTCYVRGNLFAQDQVAGGPGGFITDGTIEDVDIAATSSIADTSLATISTPGKVSGDAITSGTIGGSTVINSSGSLTSGPISIDGSVDVLSTGVASQLRFGDGDASNYVGFVSPPTLTGSQIWELPGTDGTNGQILGTNGTGGLTWFDQITPVVSVNGQTGSVVLGNADVGAIAAGLKGAAGGVASLDGSGFVIQDPASAATSSTADAIVKATPGALIDLSWLPTNLTGKDADTLDGIEGANLVQTSRTISGSGGIQGGGNLSANRSLDLSLAAGGGLSKTLGSGDELGIGANAVTSAMIQDDAVLSANIAAGAVSNAHVNASAGINANKLGATGNVSNAEYSYLNGLGGPLQAEIDSKGDIFNGGQAGAFSLGTTDSNPLNLITNGSNRLKIDDQGRVIIGPTASTIHQLDVAGGIKVGDVATVCNGTLAGTIRINSGKFQGCDGSAWVGLDTNGGISSCRVRLETVSGTGGASSSWSSYSSGNTEQCTGWQDSPGGGEEMRLCIQCQ